MTDFTGAAGRQALPPSAGVEHIEAGAGCRAGNACSSLGRLRQELGAARRPALHASGVRGLDRHPAAETIPRSPSGSRGAGGATGREAVRSRRARRGCAPSSPRCAARKRWRCSSTRSSIEGIPAPLFGRDAMTTHARATLAMKLGLPVVPFAIRRTRGANFVVAIRPPIPLAPHRQPGPRHPRNDEEPQPLHRGRSPPAAPPLAVDASALAHRHAPSQPGRGRGSAAQAGGGRNPVPTRGSSGSATRPAFIRLTTSGPVSRTA